MPKNLKKILIALLTIYLGGFAYLIAFQRHYLYHPNHEYVSPESLDLGIAFKEFPARTQDGIDLKGWYMPATTKPLTIVFFHGNADHLSNAAPVAKSYIAAGYGFLVTEYRGFSGMAGRPTEDGFYDDARTFINKLIADGIKPQNIVLMGHSLGSGVATQMASEFPVGGLILVAPFTSIPDMAQLQYPYYPARYFVWDRFDNAAKIADLPMPILIVNGDKDDLVPITHGQHLFDLAHAPKQYHLFPDRDHSDILNSEFYDLNLKWLDQLQNNLLK